MILKNTLTLLSVISFLLISFSGVSQSAIEQRLKTKYVYTIEHIESLDQLENIQNSISELKFVEKVQLNYKPEKSNKGQLLIFINEPKRTSESQIMFDPTILKKRIFIDEINLIDLKIENY
jgi:hypothetical protein